ncbi:MAG: MBOAT family O-acyltransferase [Roseburia sp.]
MTFASVSFLLFFVVVLLVQWLVFYVLPLQEKRRNSVSHICLWIASYVFYGWWDARFLTLLLGVTLVAFFTAAPRVENRPVQSRVRLGIGVGVPLLVLGVFKYFDFFVESFCQAFGLEPCAGLSLILPVGISFYTFQSLSYTIDVYQGKIPREKSFVRFALYISFFPQLVAGPIVKAADFLPQLNQNRRITLHRLEKGLQIFVFGMFKKVVLADNLSIFVDEVFETPGMFSSGTVALAVISYGIQIYMDFSGYSDMAIGCAHCLGYDLNRNFNLPYLSRNVSEFWKRWHISLSGWLQQYLYIPLGGNRKGELRTYLNLMITMLLGGLWHGAGWNFVVWGGLHGAALCVHKMYCKWRKKKKAGEPPLPVRVVNILLTDLFVLFCWIFFRAEDFCQARQVLRQIFSFQSGVRHIYSWSIVALILVIAATFVAVFAAYRQRKQGKTVKSIDGFYPVMDLNRYWCLVVFFVEIGLILGLAYVGGSPFIYFQF